jgi:hypothetical protein
MCLVTLEVEIGWAPRMVLRSRILNTLDGFQSGTVCYLSRAQTSTAEPTTAEQAAPAAPPI